MADLFEDLKKDREKLQSSDKVKASNSSAWVEEISKNLKRRSESRSAYTSVADFSLSEKALVTRLSEANNLLEVKFAISKVLDTYFPDNDLNVSCIPKANPRLLTFALTACRNFNEPGMAHSLMQIILNKSLYQRLIWIEVDCLNELIRIEWEISESIDRVENVLKLMESYGLSPTSKTFMILENIRKSCKESQTQSEKCTKLLDFAKALEIFRIK